MVATALCMALVAVCCVACLIAGYCVGRGNRMPRTLEACRIFLAAKEKEKPATPPEKPLEQRAKFEF